MSRNLKIIKIGGKRYKLQEGHPDPIGPKGKQGWPGTINFDFGIGDISSFDNIRKIKK